MASPPLTPEFLQDLDYHALVKMGGPEKLLEELGTHPHHGLSTPPSEDGEDTEEAFLSFIARRRRDFGSNDLDLQPAKRMKLLRQTFQEAWGTMRFFIIALLVSPILGLMENPRAGEAMRWTQRMLSDSIVVLVVITIQLSFRYYIVCQQQHKLGKLAEIARTRRVRCIRKGEEVHVLAQDIVAGDIFILESGAVAPCNGLVLAVHDLYCLPAVDGYHHLGRKKVTYKRYSTLNIRNASYSCFVSRGDRVTEGWARCVAVSVGVWFGSRRARAKSWEQGWPRSRNKLLFSLIILVMLVLPLMKYFLVPNKAEFSIIKTYLNFTLTVILVFWSPVLMTTGLSFIQARVYRRLDGLGVFEQRSGSCVRVNDITGFYFDKTGTMTNDLTIVTEGTIGATTMFERPGSRPDTGGHATSETSTTTGGLPISGMRRQYMNWMSFRDPSRHRDIFNAAIVATSSAPDGGESATRNGVDWCLLNFAQEMGWPDPADVWDTMKVVENIPFSSARRAGGSFVRLPNGGTRLYLKGAKDEILPRCTEQLLVPPLVDLSEKEASEWGSVSALGDVLRGELNELGDRYANNGLRSIVLGYKDFDQTLTPDLADDSSPQMLYDEVAHNLTLIGLLCLEDSLNDGVRTALTHLITRCGIEINLCTGDSHASAKAVARSCGIMGQIHTSMTPQRKKELFECLTTVAMVGNGTNDILAFQSVRASFCMGQTGTDSAKDTADIVLQNDDLKSIADVIQQGRMIVDAMSKSCDFRCCAGATLSAIITFLAVASPSSMEPIFSRNQLLWIFVIISPATLCAFSMSSPDFFLAPLTRNGSFKTSVVRHQYFLNTQVLLQPIFALVSYYVGPSLISVVFDGGDGNKFAMEQIQPQTSIFNTFILMQIFTCVRILVMDKRVVDRNFFMWAKMHWISFSVFFFVLVFHYLVVMHFGSIFQTSPLDWQNWIVSLAFSLGCIGVGELLPRQLRYPF